MHFQGLLHGIRKSLKTICWCKGSSNIIYKQCEVLEGWWKMNNGCNCGICDYINDCGGDGDWKPCRVNKMLEIQRKLEEENEELKRMICSWVEFSRFAYKLKKQ